MSKYLMMKLETTDLHLDANLLVFVYLTGKGFSPIRSYIFCLRCVTGTKAVFNSWWIPKEIKARSKPLV